MNILFVSLVSPTMDSPIFELFLFFLTKSHTLCTKISEWVTKAECKLYLTGDMDTWSRAASGEEYSS
jgi:hypothetical protein